MSVQQTEFDFTMPSSPDNAMQLADEVDKAFYGDIYISDADSVWERKKGVDLDYISVTFSNSDGVVGYLYILKENGVEKSSYYRPVDC